MSLFGSSSLSSSNNSDYTVPSPPDDGISSLSFNNAGNALIAGSWNNQVRCWEIQRSGNAVNAIPRGEMSHQAPVLTTSFNHDNTTVYSGGVDNMVKKWDLIGAGQPAVDIGKHDAPVRKVHWVQALSLVASGSWDKTIKFWDTRAQQPAHTIQLSERVYEMDIRDNFMVVCTADKKTQVFDLANQCRLESLADSTLSYQTTSLAILTDCKGFATGSIEGRVAIDYFNEIPTATGQSRMSSISGKKGFSFKCHRDAGTSKNPTVVHTINCISMHRLGTFATAGSDGLISFWDKDSKQRLKIFSKQNNSISAAMFSQDGTMYAYAVSYDWSQGVHGATPQKPPPAIHIHSVEEVSIAPRDKSKK